MKILEQLNVKFFVFLIVFYLFCEVYSNLLKTFAHKNTGTLKCRILGNLIFVL